MSDIEDVEKAGVVGDVVDFDVGCERLKLKRDGLLVLVRL